MKFTLKDYQTDAVREALDHLKWARKAWHEGDRRHAFSLTAVTGATKPRQVRAFFCLETNWQLIAKKTLDETVRT